VASVHPETRILVLPRIRPLLRTRLATIVDRYANLSVERRLHVYFFHTNLHYCSSNHRQAILHVTVPTHVWRENAARLSIRPGLNTVVASIVERLATSVLTAPNQLATRLVTTAEVKDTLPRNAPIHENKVHYASSC
jgi:hypothetical protein